MSDDLLDELLDELVEDEVPPPARLPTPPLGDIPPLPRKGDMYYYKSYQGDIVQGEILNTIVYCEVRNPDGTYQTIPVQDLSLNKSKVSDSSPTLKRWTLDNSKLLSQYNALLKRIETLNAQLDKT